MKLNGWGDLEDNSGVVQRTWEVCGDVEYEVFVLKRGFVMDDVCTLETSDTLDINIRYIHACSS